MHLGPSAHTTTSSLQPAKPASLSVVVTQLVGWSLAFLLLALPFETGYGVVLPGLTLTVVELIALAVLLLWSTALIIERRLPRVRWLLWPALLFSGALVLSGALAPQFRGEALKFALRQAQGAALGLCLADQVFAHGWPFARRLLVALALGGVASALLGLLEMTETPTMLLLLGVFKPQLSLVEGALRLSATFSYANIAAMYYEALLPLALAASLGLLAGRWRWLGAALAAVLLAATILTYSRAALLGIAFVLAATPLLVGWRWRGGQLFRRSALLSLALAALALIPLLSSPTLRLRLYAPNTGAWLSAKIEASPIPQLDPSVLTRIQLNVTNDGRAAWEHAGLRPVMLAYHWYDAETGDLFDYEGLRTPLPRDIAPGETIALSAQIMAPASPGRYVLAWDMLREQGGGWFKQATPQKGTLVIVGGAITAPRPAPVPFVEEDLPSPARGVLWQAATQLWRERPLLGIGPDVFRHVYGPRLGLARWDERIHTNNLYLEILTGAGLIGLSACLALFGTLARHIVPVLLRPRTILPTQPHSAWAWWCLLASSLGIAVFLIHGLLDVFLAFTATYVLFWCWIGLAAACAERLAQQALRPE
ncbi:MAG: O-antigen ligase family protein [Roseiflexaceae bacterium]|nr:O-antigen ligase family protein [Roseiflexaceae bacterium]